MATFVLLDPYPTTSVGPVSADLDDYVRNPMHEHGDIIVGGVSGSATRLAGNTSTTVMYLSQTGDGSTAGDPTWVGIGPQGTTGSQGITGIQGNLGIQGSTGIGIQGPIGLQGISGSIGTGIQGIAGSQGLVGSRGVQGVIGTGGAQGNSGAQGGTGVTGVIGPGVCFQGDFNPAHVYYNNSLRRDIVRYGTDYYIYKGTDDTASAWNINNWEAFGATFNSVATEILFANFGYVDNLGVREFEGVGRTVGDLSGTLATVAPDHIDASPGVKQVETITLTGSEGYATIGVFNKGSHHCLWNESLTQTATDFVSEHSFADIDLSSDGPKIIFTAAVENTGFIQPTITNVSQLYRGAVKIQGNDIWENVTENNTNGGLYINRRSWGGGQGYYRFLSIGDGMGGTLAVFAGNAVTGTFGIYCPNLYIPTLPTSANGLLSGMVYNDNGTLKVVL